MQYFTLSACKLLHISALFLLKILVTTTQNLVTHITTYSVQGHPCTSTQATTIIHQHPYFSLQYILYRDSGSGKCEDFSLFSCNSTQLLDGYTSSLKMDRQHMSSTRLYAFPKQYSVTFQQNGFASTAVVLFVLNYIHF